MPKNAKPKHKPSDTTSAPQDAPAAQPRPRQATYVGPYVSDNPCPADPLQALDWIRVRAGLCYSLSLNPAAPIQHGGQEFHYGQVLVILKRESMWLYESTMRHMPDWVSLEFKRHCEWWAAAEINLPAARELWEQLELEAEKRFHALKQKAELPPPPPAAAIAGPQAVAEPKPAA